MNLLYIGTVFQDTIISLDCPINFGTSNPSSISNTFGGIANILQTDLINLLSESSHFILLSDNRNISNLYDYCSDSIDLSFLSILDFYPVIPKSIIIEEHGLRRTSFSQFPNIKYIPTYSIDSLVVSIHKQSFDCLALIYGETLPLKPIFEKMPTISEKILAVDFCCHELTTSLSTFLHSYRLFKCKELLIFCSQEDIDPLLYDLIKSFNIDLILVAHSPELTCLTDFQGGKLIYSENIHNNYYIPKDVKSVNGLGDKFMLFTLSKYIVDQWQLRDSIIFAQKAINQLLQHEL